MRRNQTSSRAAGAEAAVEGDAEGAGVGAACTAAEGFLLPQAPRARQLLGRRRDPLPGPALAADKLRRDRLSLGLRPVDRLVHKRAPGLAARVTSRARGSGQLVALERPIDLPRADQRRVS